MTEAQRLAKERNWLMFRLKSIEATYGAIQQWCDGAVVITHMGVADVERAIDEAYQKKLARARRGMLRSPSLNP